MGIPHCCDEPLEVFMRVPGYEYRCKKCGQLYEFFDGFKRIDRKNMTDAQKQLAVERGWVIEEFPQGVEK